MKRTLLVGALAVALLGMPSFARAGVRISLGFPLPFPFFAVAPPPVVVPAPVYAPAYAPYPPAVAYVGPTYYGAPVVVYGRRFGGRRAVWYRHGHRW